MSNIRFDFAGRVALITGGASGIGRETAALLRRSGATVAILDVNAGAVRSVSAELDVIGIDGDVRRSADLDGAVARLESEVGGVDILACCAGVSGESLATVDVGDAEWERVMAINSTGTFIANRAVLPGMKARGYGRIVNVASIAGKEGNPMACAYSASKAAVIGMTKAIGKDVARTGILVNCVAPAVIDTPILADMTAEHVAYMASKIPLGRVGTTDEVARLIAYLSSEDMSFSTAAVFDLSGGRATY